MKRWHKTVRHIKESYHCIPELRILSSVLDINAWGRQIEWEALDNDSISARGRPQMPRQHLVSCLTGLIGVYKWGKLWSILLSNDHKSSNQRPNWANRSTGMYDRPYIPCRFIWSLMSRNLWLLLFPCEAFIITLDRVKEKIYSLSDRSIEPVQESPIQSAATTYNTQT